MDLCFVVIFNNNHLYQDFCSAIYTLLLIITFCSVSLKKKPQTFQADYENFCFAAVVLTKLSIAVTPKHGGEKFHFTFGKQNHNSLWKFCRSTTWNILRLVKLFTMNISWIYFYTHVKRESAFSGLHLNLYLWSPHKWTSPAQIMGNSAADDTFRTFFWYLCVNKAKG